MAANKRKITACQTTRDKIKTGMIVKKLSDHVEDPEKTKMTGTQVRAAECLLARTMPTLTMADIVNHEAPENYQEQLQGLKDMAGDNWRQVFALLNIEIIDNETNQGLN